MPDIFWEDFVEGEVKTFGSYEVTEDEIIAFASEFDAQPMHLDAAAGKASMLGGLAASGWHTCAIMMRLMCDGFLLRAAGQGSPGVTETKWREPIFPGDVVTLRRTVLQSRSSKSRPELGLVTLKLELLKPAGSVALEQECVVLFSRRNPGARLA
ncbi:MAG: dehydratase [Rhizobiales bacterium 24-66-13]|jgi:acyl dehydratase|uniref:MaoC family dehydratase n=1 Tax=Roseixanthobacter finlandensis TaxID=3119922 RepID=UPI000BCD3281|nr:MAG: dehydratase [Rhizobiales bacterium 12-66-7]OYZ75103.1 MAG: dehydratase [Rhizobiales bacterium 24-66-13]OZB04282.1 MAG: dehydratase [Rhizobiales bacterium 39-66-18]HQS09763.1 MaoC family dehydratase [Xanthobacteraceae bacterium]HQS48427.1 MaoC family dehydratase [Xanthobacteraceae bacterium]